MYSPAGTWLSNNRPSIVRPSSRSAHPVLRLDLSTVASEAHITDGSPAANKAAFHDVVLRHLDEVARKYGTAFTSSDSTSSAGQLVTAVDELLAALEETTGESFCGMPPDDALVCCFINATATYMTITHAAHKVCVLLFVWFVREAASCIYCRL
jgi:hypothetical protein